MCGRAGTCCVLDSLRTLRKTSGSGIFDETCVHVMSLAKLVTMGVMEVRVLTDCVSGLGKRPPSKSTRHA